MDGQETGVQIPAGSSLACIEFYYSFLYEKGSK